MYKQSAGILMFKFEDKKLYVFLVHPGGHYWAGKDSGSWSIPKGELEEDENPWQAAKREIEEETGINIFSEHVLQLTPVHLKSGKQVYAWAVEGNADPTKIKSNSFEIEWPPGTGRKQKFPEINKAGWFDLSTAKQKINVSQVALLNELSYLLQNK